MASVFAVSKRTRVVVGPLQACPRPPLQLVGHITHVITLYDPGDVVNEGDPLALLNLALHRRVNLDNANGGKGSRQESPVAGPL